MSGYTFKIEDEGLTDTVVNPTLYDIESNLNLCQQKLKEEETMSSMKNRIRVFLNHGSENYEGLVCESFSPIIQFLKDDLSVQRI